MVLPIRILNRFCIPSIALSLSGMLAACSGDANPVRDGFVAVGAGPQTATTPDFVRQSRPETLEYVPIGTAAPERPTPARTADEVKAAEAQMDATRAQNEAAARAAKQAGATPPPAPAGRTIPPARRSTTGSQAR